jgi:hypothetical protein
MLRGAPWPECRCFEPPFLKQDEIKQFLIPHIVFYCISAYLQERDLRLRFMSPLEPQLTASVVY